MEFQVLRIREVKSDMPAESPSSPNRRHARIHFAIAVFIVGIAALGIGLVFHSFRTAAAQAQDLPEVVNGTPDHAQNDQVQPPDPLAQLAEAANVADCQSQRDAYERTLPVPSQAELRWHSEPMQRFILTA